MRIAQVMPSEAWGSVTPDKLEQGIGGREGAMIRLAREWARAGHQVTNFVSTKEPARLGEGEGFHEYVSIGISRSCLANFEYDAVVAWECPSVFNSPAIVDRQPVRLAEMQCAHFPSDEEKVAAESLATGVVALSEWHRDFMVWDGLELPEDRLHVLPNCVDLEHYPAMDAGEIAAKQEGPTRLFYSSSPDRGLWHLLRLWPRLMELDRRAELHVAYGVQRWLEQALWAHSRMGEMAIEIAALMGQDGVVDHGVIGQAELAGIQRSCNLWAYPCDTMQPTETGCITAVEAAAAYCPILTTDCDCMGEEFGGIGAILPMPYNEDQFVSVISEVLADGLTYTSMAEGGRAFVREGRQWSQVAGRWLDLFRSERVRS